MKNQNIIIISSSLGLADCWKQCITEDPVKPTDDVDEGIYDDLDELHMYSPLESAPNNKFADRSAERKHSRCDDSSPSTSKCGISSDLVQLVKRIQLSNKVRPFQVRCIEFLNW